MNHKTLEDINMKRFNLSSPIVVGGLGNCGTRVVANILKKMKFYLGYHDLNTIDNIWFPSLFYNRPKWYISTSKHNNEAITKALHMFEKMMFAPFISRYSILKALLEYICFINSKEYKANFRYCTLGLRPRLECNMPQLLLNHLNENDYVGWGWKEPISCMYIEYLNDHYQNMKYIHMIRNGFDASIRFRHPQLYDWCGVFKLKIDPTDDDIRANTLKYWINVNKNAINLGKKLLQNRFLLIRLEDLYNETEETVAKIADFLSIDNHHINSVELCSIVKKPESLGLYKKHDLSFASKEDLRCIKELGYEV